KGKDVIIIDDLIDTADTIIEASYLLENHGVGKMYASCTHPVLSGNAITKIKESKIIELIVTDTIPVNGGNSKIKILTVASLISETIIKVVNNSSLNELSKRIDK